MRIPIPINLRWSDLDAFGHVNNVQVARILEEARVRAFWADSADSNPLPTAVIDAGPNAKTWTLIARQEIEYLTPMPYFKDPVIVQAWFGKLGGASVDICYEIFSPENSEQVKFVQAQATLVLFDPITQRPQRLSEDYRKVWEPYLDQPIQFRRA